MPIPNRKDNIEKLSTKERVYNVLREWIADGTLQPQERLNDKELAAHFSVSRTPVREALQMLIEQKFVTVRPSSGTFVAPLDREDMACVYQMIAALQCMALELAFSRIDKIRKVSHGSEKDSLYLQGRTRYNNPEISIVYATEDQLKQLPPVVIAYSEYDFLRVSDEYFARRLTGVNHDVKAIMYCGCDHGFLDCLGLVPQAEELCHVIAEEVSTL